MEIENNLNEFLDKEIQGDCLELLDRIPSNRLFDRIPSNSIDLIYSDLPYNEKSINYGSDPRDPNNFPRSLYLAWVRNVVTKCYRVSRGYIALQIGEGYDVERVGTLQNAYTKEGLIPDDFSVIHQTKNSDYTSRLLIGSKNREIIRLNKPYWDLREVQYKNVLRGIHPATTCPEIAKTLIELFTKPGDTVLDICNGTRTTTDQAKKLGRHFIGFELYNWGERFLEKDPVAKTLGREAALKYYEGLFR